MSGISLSTTTEMKDSWVVFQSSQGIEIRATLLRLNRYSVVFELYSLNTVLRVSEVLSELRIVYQDQTIYSGRAVVRSQVSTGLVVVCEAALEEGWVDVNFVIGAGQGGKLREGFGEFMREWQKLYRVSPEYKVVIADLQTFLTDLRLWLDQIELGIRSSPSEDRLQLERQVAHDLQEQVIGAINSLFERYEIVAQSIDEELQSAHRVFGKRQLHPLLLSSPFVYRTYRKPLGYAGDYEMVNMMFREPCEGSSLFAKIVNAYALRLPPIIAHRNRITYLTEQLQAEARRALLAGRRAKIFNVGCGPAQEIQTFLTQNDLCDHAQFTLIDFNDETLMHLGQTLEALKHRHSRRTPFELKKKSVHHILKEAGKVVHGSNGDRFDFAYCAGLFDYLSDKVCRQLIEIFYQQLAPGGLLVVTNADNHPSRGEMECFLEWHLVYRDTKQVAGLVPSHISPENVAIKRDSTGVNLFLELRKPQSVKP
jgi:extracellular factor (EF) 3-hydroxypalmitic acid methyl ester biosynthesis protein